MESVETIQIFSKVLTGLLLLLNFSLLISIRLALKWAKKTTELDSSPDTAGAWIQNRRVLAALIVIVIAMNGASVYANMKLKVAGHEMAAQLDSVNPTILVGSAR